ncbi:MAG: tripartite tricarboxylate transporter substrate binding protein [Rhodospirillales bacterium]
MSGLGMKTIFSAMAISLISASAFAEFPEKPVKLIIGYSPGGGTDTYGRALASVAPEYLNEQPLIIVNKPGGSGLPAAKLVAESNADGYTLYLASGGSYYFSTQFRKDPDADPFKDFKMVCMVGLHFPAIYVHKDSKYKTLQDLAADIKAKPGELRYATTGRTSVWGIASLAFLQKNDMGAVGVPATGGGPARALLIGNQVDFGIIGVNLIKGFEDSLRMLAVMYPDRDQGNKEIPTVEELGLKSLEVSTPTILMAPKDVPDAVIAKLDSACKQMAEHKAFKELLQKSGLSAKYRSSAETVTYIKELTDSWQPLIADVKKMAPSQ